MDAFDVEGFSIIQTAREPAIENTGVVPAEAAAPLSSESSSGAGMQAANRSVVENTGSVYTTTPHLVVDEAFNVLTGSDSGDRSLESALLSRRDQMVGSARHDRLR